GTSWLTTGASASFTYALSNWYHIAYVVTPTNYTILIDGQVEGSGSYSASSPLLFDQNHHLLVGITGAGDYMVGLIDEVRVWDVARTQAQIQANMNCELAGTEPGLDGYWRFDEGTGTTTADSSGHGFTGSLIWQDLYPIWVPSTAPIT